MTNAEAKELLAHKLRQIIDNWDGTTETKLLGDAFAVAVSAIDRATPKKVKQDEKICPCCGKSEPVPGWYVCGACGATRRHYSAFRRGICNRLLSRVRKRVAQRGGME